MENEWYCFCGGFYDKNIMYKVYFCSRVLQRMSEMVLIIWSIKLRIGDFCVNI